MLHKKPGQQGRVAYALGLLLAAVLVLAACSSGKAASAGSDSPKTITLGIQDTFSHVPVYVAEDQGFFRQHGIGTVNLKTFSALPAMLTAASHAQIDAAFQSPAAVIAYNASTTASKLRFFMPGEGPTWNVVARKGSGIPVATGEDWTTSVKAWRGKKIGVGVAGGITTSLVKYMASQAGLDPNKDITVVPLGTDASIVAAFKANEVDIALGGVNVAPSIIAAGVGYSTVNFVAGQGPANVKSIMLVSYFAPVSSLAKDKQLYADFAAAMQQARTFLLNPANRSAVTKTIAKHIGVPQTQAQALAENLDVFKTDDSQATVARTLSAFQALGAVKPPLPSYSELVENPQS